MECFIGEDDVVVVFFVGGVDGFLDGCGVEGGVVGGGIEVSYGEVGGVKWVESESG